MVRALLSSQVRSVVIRNGVRLVKLGIFAAGAMFSNSVFRTLCTEFIDQAFDDYHMVKEVVQESMS